MFLEISILHLVCSLTFFVLETIFEKDREITGMTRGV